MDENGGVRADNESGPTHPNPQYGVRLPVELLVIDADERNRQYLITVAGDGLTYPNEYVGNQSLRSRWSRTKNFLKCHKLCPPYAQFPALGEVAFLHSE